MKAITRFNLKDIRDFEETTGESIIKIYKNFSLENMMTLVKLGNSNCDDTRAGDIIGEYTRLGYSLDDLYDEIKTGLFGPDDDHLDSENYLDLDNFRNFTDLLDTYCMQLWSLGVPYETFWSFNTNNLYKVFNSIQIKRQNEINQQLALSHLAAIQNAQAFAGKLPRKPMQVNFEDQLNTVDARRRNDIKLVTKFNSLFRALEAKNSGGDTSGR